MSPSVSANAQGVIVLKQGSKETTIADPVTFLAGTTKGLFVFIPENRVAWELSGPHCKSWPINQTVGEGDRLWAAGGNEWLGAAGRYPPDASAVVWKSTDGRASWTKKQAGQTGTASSAFCGRR